MPHREGRSSSLSSWNPLCAFRLPLPACRLVLPSVPSFCVLAFCVLRESGAMHAELRTQNSELLLGCLLLACDCALARTFPRTSIGVGPLTAYRQRTAVTEPAIAVDLHQPLDVDADVSSQIALDLAFILDDLTDLADVVFAEILDPHLRADFRLLQDLVGARTPDPE